MVHVLSAVNVLLIGSSLLAIFASVVAFELAPTDSRASRSSFVLLLLGGLGLRLGVARLDPYLNLWDEQFHALVAKTGHVFHTPYRLRLGSDGRATRIVAGTRCCRRSLRRARLAGLPRPQSHRVQDPSVRMGRTARTGGADHELTRPQPAVTRRRVWPVGNWRRSEVLMRRARNGPTLARCQATRTLISQPSGLR